MAKSTTDESLKDLLSQIAGSVSHLPEHLQQAAFTTLLNRALDSSTGNVLGIQGGKVEKPGGAHQRQAAPADSFGEYYATFPPKLSEDDKILIAASFAEAQSDDKTYTAESAHSLLKGIGIKLSNAGVYARRLVKPKGWAIIIGKEGKQNYKFRVSNNGHKELKRLKEQPK